VHAVPVLPCTSLETVKTVSDIASNSATVAAVVIGAVWAYWRFVRERNRWPRANLELVLTHYRLTDSTVVLNAKVKVHNAGRGLMKLEELRVDLYRVLPLVDGQGHAVDVGTLVPQGEVAAEWPPIDQRKKKWSGKQRPELEPSENDEFCCDFLVYPKEQVVFVYAYLGNAAKRHGTRELGWPVTSFYDLAGLKGGQSSDNLVPKEGM
jgi:hypothetical protein